MALASRTNQRVSAGIASAMAQEPGLDVVGVEEQQVALDQRDGEAGDRAGVGAAVQLVEAVAAGDAAEQRVARVHHLVQQVGEGRADRDEHAVEHARG